MASVSSAYELPLLRAALASPWHQTQTGTLTTPSPSPSSHKHIGWLCLKGMNERLESVSGRAARGVLCANGRRCVKAAANILDFSYVSEINHSAGIVDFSMIP